MVLRVQERAQVVPGVPCPVYTPRVHPPALPCLCTPCSYTPYCVSAMLLVCTGPGLS